jgi:hypothetical protein
MCAAAIGFGIRIYRIYRINYKSLVFGGRLFLNGAFISKPPAAALRSVEKDDKK